MRLTAEQWRQQRAAWRVAGRCTGCGGALHAATDSGYLRCLSCRVKGNTRNRASYDRIEGTARTQDVADAVAAMRRHAHECALRSYAEATGRVPTLRTAAAIIGSSHHLCSTVQAARRRAFGLRKARSTETRVVIPYPVPDEWKA